MAGDLQMSWVKRKLRNWLLNNDPNETSKQLAHSRDVESVSDGDPILNFRVFSAIGGRVVEFRTYDRQKDRNFTQTYIITNDQDFGERIAKIATMESLKS
jgi:hypothetical protein